MVKKLIAICLLILSVFALSACGNQPKEAETPAYTDVPPAERMALSDLVSSVIPDAGDLVSFDEEDLTDILGIEPEEYTEFVYLQENGLSGREILALRAVDADAAGRIAQRLENYLEQRRKETRNYAPEAYQLLAAAKVETKNLTVALVSGENAAQERAQLLAGE